LEEINSYITYFLLERDCECFVGGKFYEDNSVMASINP
jgi:hypothetical protein